MLLATLLAVGLLAGEPALENPNVPLSLTANRVFADEFDTARVAAPDGVDAAGQERARPQPLPGQRHRAGRCREPHFDRRGERQSRRGDLALAGGAVVERRLSEQMLPETVRRGSSRSAGL